jgi:hypothetical protein
MATGNNFVQNPGGGVSPARAPNFADQPSTQKARDEAYVKKDATGTVFPELTGSPQVGTGVGVPK